MRALSYTAGSPFARAVRIVLSELELDYERYERTVPLTSEQAAQQSPTLQVPVYWDDNVRLWESSLIAEYLLKNCLHRLAESPPLAERAWRASDEWRDRLVLSSVQTLGIAVTTISQLKWTGIALADNEHLTRSAERIHHLLIWLETELPNDRAGFLPDCLSLQDIFLVCHLAFVQNRPLDLDLDLGRFPRISALVQRLQRRSSFEANPILWWDPLVTGYKPDGTPVYGN